MGGSCLCTCCVSFSSRYPSGPSPRPANHPSRQRSIPPTVPRDRPQPRRRAPPRRARARRRQRRRRSLARRHARGDLRGAAEAVLVDRILSPGALRRRSGRAAWPPSTTMATFPGARLRHHSRKVPSFDAHRVCSAVPLLPRRRRDVRSARPMEEAPAPGRRRRRRRSSTSRTPPVITPRDDDRRGCPLHRRGHRHRELQPLSVVRGGVRRAAPPSPPTSVRRVAPPPRRRGHRPRSRLARVYGGRRERRAHSRVRVPRWAPSRWVPRWVPKWASSRRGSRPLAPARAKRHLLRVRASDDVSEVSLGDEEVGEGEFLARERGGVMLETDGREPGVPRAERRGSRGRARGPPGSLGPPLGAQSARVTRRTRRGVSGDEVVAGSGGGVASPKVATRRASACASRSGRVHVVGSSPHMGHAPSLAARPPRGLPREIGVRVDDATGGGRIGGVVRRLVPLHRGGTFPSAARWSRGRIAHARAPLRVRMWRLDPSQRSRTRVSPGTCRCRAGEPAVRPAAAARGDSGRQLDPPANPAATSSTRAKGIRRPGAPVDARYAHQVPASALEDLVRARQLAASSFSRVSDSRNARLGPRRILRATHLDSPIPHAPRSIWWRCEPTATFADCKGRGR